MVHPSVTAIDPQDEKAVRRIIFRLAGPSSAEMLLINMTQMMMMILVGHLGAIAVAAVGLTSQPYILGGALRGAGDTRFPLYSTLIGVWGVRVLLSYLFLHLLVGDVRLMDCCCLRSIFAVKFDLFQV